MSYTEFFFIGLLCVFALACIAVAFIFGASWYLGIGSMASILAMALYYEYKSASV